MKNFLIPAALVLGLASLNSCTQLTQTARLAEGPVVLGVDTIKAHVNVDTTTSLIGMSSTTHMLGFSTTVTTNFSLLPCWQDPRIHSI